MSERAMRRAHGRCGIRAFTLIGLLVTIAVIVLLVSLLQTCIPRNNELRPAVICAHNMKAMDIAFRFYQEDWSGHAVIPWQKQAGPEDSANLWHLQWPFVMAYYSADIAIGPTTAVRSAEGWYNPETGRNDIASGIWGHPLWGRNRSQVLHCPTLQNRQIGHLPGPGHRSGTEWDCYTNFSMAFINARWALGERTNLWYRVKSAEFIHPGESICLMDLSSASRSDPNLLGPWTTFGCYRTNPHIEASNYLFLDGHVERLETNWTPSEDPPEQGHIEESMFQAIK